MDEEASQQKVAQQHTAVSADDSNSAKWMLLVEDFRKRQRLCSKRFRENRKRRAQETLDLLIEARELNKQLKDEIYKLQVEKVVLELALVKRFRAIQKQQQQQPSTGPAGQDDDFKVV
jgi:hypothetical protein